MLCCVVYIIDIKHLLGGDDSGKFDSSKYFELTRKTADIIEIFLKNKVEDIPIAKKVIIGESDIVKRIKIWKYIHCIDITEIYLALSQTSNDRNDNNNNNNDNSSNSNNNDISVDETKCRKNMVALQNKIDLDVEIYNYKKNHNWVLTKAKQPEIEKEFLDQKHLQKSDLALESFAESKKQAKEKQQFKIKERVEKQHKIMEFFAKK